MKAALLKTLLKQVLPMLAGGLGAWLLTAYPVVHSAFCEAKF